MKTRSIPIQDEGKKRRNSPHSAEANHRYGEHKSKNDEKGVAIAVGVLVTDTPILELGDRQQNAITSAETRLPWLIGELLLVEHPGGLPLDDLKSDLGAIELSSETAWSKLCFDDLGVHDVSGKAEHREIELGSFVRPQRDQAYQNQNRGRGDEGSHALWSRHRATVRAEELLEV